MAEGDFQGADSLGRMDVDGNSAAVVLDRHVVSFVDRDPDGVAETGNGFVYGVVHDFIDKMVKTVWTCGTDVHAGPDTYRLQAFEDLYVLSGVFLRGVGEVVHLLFADVFFVHKI